MHPFCSNPLCLANGQQVEDDEMHLEGRLSNGLDISVARVLAVNHMRRVRVPFCTACANVFAIIRGEAFPLPVGTKGMGAFCSNQECFAHSIEVPADQKWIELSLGASNSRRMDREWLISEAGISEPFCSSCANVFNIILGDPEYPDANEGIKSEFSILPAE